MNPEQKKMAILAALAIGVVTIGAGQFMGHRRPPPLPDKTKKTMVADDDAAPQVTAPGGIKNPQVADSLPDRDPFAPPADALPNSAPTKGVMGAKGVDAPKPFPSRGRLARAKGFEPLPLPGALPGKGGVGPGGLTLTPTQDYRCVAVIQGSQPIAVFEDRTGNQKLVHVGASVDGETKLTEVHGNSVSISVRGQSHRLTIGGNPVGK